MVSPDMSAFTAPFYERIKEISSNEAYISKEVRMGKRKAQENAAKTIREVREVREIIGFKRF